jgi:putative ABC transport system substrate-binding protein
MTRVVSVAMLLVAALAAPLATPAQSPRLFRVGYLGGDPLVTTDPGWQGFGRALHEQGYTEGQNLAIEYRSAEGRNEAFPALAAELVKLKVDLIVAHAVPAGLAAKQATSTIPIVLFNVADPVGAGLVMSLAHPGGNVTGVSSQGADFYGKLVELAKEAVPRLTRIAAISSATNPAQAPLVKELATAASALGITLDSFPIREPTDVQLSFTAMARSGAQAVVVLPEHVTWSNRARIVDLAARGRLPTVCVYRVWADAGCLMGYGPSVDDMLYRAGVLAGKILKGAKPADLPVEQPTKFELVINLKTAKTLGLTIPPAVLARADEVIE